VRTNRKTLLEKVAPLVKRLTSKKSTYPCLHPAVQHMAAVTAGLPEPHSVDMHDDTAVAEEAERIRALPVDVDPEVGGNAEEDGVESTMTQVKAITGV
jgi:hypothetical protein